MGQTLSTDPSRYIMERIDAPPAWVEDDPAPSDEYYRLVHLDADGYRESVTGTLVWMPMVGRAGIAWGADPDWTDAASPEDALRRWATGDMAP